MSTDKVSEYHVYKFSEINLEHSDRRIERDKLEIIDFPNLTPKENDNIEGLLSEVEVAQTNDFLIHDDVSKYRGLKKAREDSISETVEKRVADEVEKLKKEAFNKGYQDGLEKGMQELVAKEQKAVDQKIEEVGAMVHNVLTKQDELLNLQEKENYKFLREVTKWICLKELDKDNDYLERLFSKVISENKESTKISFVLGSGIRASFPEAVSVLKESFDQKYGENVQIKDGDQLDRDAIDVELEQTILKVGFNDQIQVLNELFSEIVGDYESP